MEEFETVGAQEWLLDLDEPPRRPKEITSQNPLANATLGNRAGNEVVAPSRLQDAPVIQRPIAKTMAANRSSPVQVNIQPPAIRRSTQPQNSPKPVSQPVQAPLPAGRARPVWANHHRLPNGRSGPQSNNRARNPDDTPAKAAWRAGQPFTDQIRLPGQYGELKQRIIERSKAGASSEMERDFFAKVMTETGTFFPVPQTNDRFLRVWGTPAQVRQARLLVSQLVAPYVPAEIPAKKKSENFVKIQSYSDRKEERIDQVEKHESILQTLRRKPDPSCMFPETLIYLWPSDELSVDCLGPQLEFLDPLRVEFGCPIYIDDELPNYIRVDGYDHETILEIVDRLRAEWAELLAITHAKVKLYLVQPPRAFTDCVIQVKKLMAASGARLYIPILHGVQLTSPLLLEGCDEIHDGRKSARTKTANRLRDAVERSLKGLRFLRGHVRMRLVFGKFLFQDYRDLKGNSCYSYEEFEAMLLVPRTKGLLVPGLDFQYEGHDLLSRIAAATDLFVPYDVTATSLADEKPHYAVNFEFQGEDASLLRLEAEFAKSPGSGLFEVSQRRWIRPWEENKAGDKRPPLQIGIIDFESCDWQLEICALDFQEPSTISQSLKAFSHSIHFKPGAKLELRGNTPRKVIYSKSVPIKRLVEKTAMRYRLKGTSYVLEVARYDEYCNVLAGTSELTETPVTSWGALIFDLQWDNMLGQHANFRLGHTAEWIPSLNTFFPDLDIEDAADMGTGFDQFIELAKRVALVLSPGPQNGAVNVVSKSAIAKPSANDETRAAGQAMGGPSNAMVLKNSRTWANVARP